MSLVSICNTGLRAYGVGAAVDALGLSESENPVIGRDVLLKPNFNTADPAPGSTDNQTLEAMIDKLWEMGAASITLGERSWKSTEQAMRVKQVGELLTRKQVRVVIFDDLPEADWVEIINPGHHWPNGFRVARPILESECLVETCCLKTHGSGGVFTMSLKLAVGVVPGRLQMPQYMNALHGSDHQRKMIAEINTAFKPAFIVLDGVDAFVDGGPSTGERVRGDVMLASRDRVAIDAAGVACLKKLGSNPAIMDTPIFAQEQIKRAVELDLGASSPKEIELAAADEASREYSDEIRRILDQG